MALAGYWGPEAILYSTNGDPARLVPITITDDATSALATLYADRNKTTTAANPTKTDALGNLSFYTDPGFYRVQLVGTTQSFLVEVRGETGSGGGAAQYEHVQSVAQSVWSINHELGLRPSAVSVFSLDYGQQYDEFTVQHVDVNNLLISMDVPTAGRALM